MSRQHSCKFSCYTVKLGDLTLFAVKHTYLEIYMRFSAVSALNSSMKCCE